MTSENDSKEEEQTKNSAVDTDEKNSELVEAQPKKKELRRYEHFERDHAILLGALQRLSEKLNELDVKAVVPLTHYRQLPEPVSQARDFLYNGAALIHGTSTKYSLLGTIDQYEQNKLKEDLMRGCNVIATGCVLVHERSIGSSRALRRHIKKTCRAIVDAVAQMVESFYNGTALIDYMGAQKAGIVWQTCDVVIDKKVPIGNRNAMRRDLFTFMMECQETMDEFQRVVDEGPAQPEAKEDQIAKESNKQEDDGWDAFASNDQLFLEKEIPVATACIALVKVSRGTINLTLQALEGIGAYLQEFLVNERDPTPKDRARFEWMERLYGLACKVGDGMTDFATHLYPTIDLKALPDQIQIHSQRLLKVINMVAEATLTDKSKVVLPPAVLELGTNLKQATAARRNDALQAVAAAKKWDKKANKKK